jgi:CubicO group peptidase (beta-lactamase class C family)
MSKHFTGTLFRHSFVTALSSVCSLVMLTQVRLHPASPSVWQALSVFMEERIFGPLEMRDSSFFTNRAKVDRIPVMYTDQNGHIAKDVMDVTPPGQKYPGSEFGLLSTAEDLRHFCQMMLNRGSWHGSIDPSLATHPHLPYASLRRGLYGRYPSDARGIPQLAPPPLQSGKNSH